MTALERNFSSRSKEINYCFLNLCSYTFRKLWAFYQYILVSYLYGLKLIKVTPQTFVKKQCTEALKQHIFNKCGSHPKKAPGVEEKFPLFSKDCNALKVENYLT